MLILHLIIIFSRVISRRYDQTDETNNATSDPRHVTDTTPPRKPVINTNLVNKVGTRTPIDVSTDVLTRVEILMKMVKVTV